MPARSIWQIWKGLTFGAKVVLLGLVAIVLNAAAVIATHDRADNSQGAYERPAGGKTPEQIASDDRNEAMFQFAVLGAKGLQSSMRDPDSFKLSSVLLMDDGAACYEYRAQNGFGGKNLGFAVASPSGQLLSDESAGFRKLWNKECQGKTGIEKTWEVGYAAGQHGLFDGPK